jgi:hypothetical protein
LFPFAGNIENIFFFPVGSVNDFVIKEKPFTTSLTALTVSIWLQIEQNNMYPTALSYSSTATNCNFEDIVLALQPSIGTHIAINDKWR